MLSLGEEQLKLEAREKEMRDMIAKAEDKRSWFPAFREWVESAATFLDAKVRSCMFYEWALLTYETLVSRAREA